MNIKKNIEKAMVEANQLMNEQLQAFARQTLKEGLSKLPRTNQALFIKMYALRGFEHEWTVDDVVDNIQPDKLYRAMQQVKRTLDSLNEHQREHK